MRNRLQTPDSPARRRQQGMTLVEVMVAVTVFSVGLLAVASLQISGLRHTQIASQRMEATLAAISMVENMRANKHARAGNFQHYRGQDRPSAVTDRTACLDDGTDCSSQEIAEFHLRRWLERVDGRLYRGRGQVCVDASPNDLVRTSSKVVDWACDGVGDTLVVKLSWREINPPGSQDRFSWESLEMPVEP